MAKYGAAAPAGFLLGIALGMRDFWTFYGPQSAVNEMVNFTNNLALAGGALALMGLGSRGRPASLSHNPKQAIDQSFLPALVGQPRDALTTEKRLYP
jgi:hypothetical protein